MPSLGTQKNPVYTSFLPLAQHWPRHGTCAPVPILLGTHISAEGKTCKPTVAERAINAQDEAAAESPESDQAKGLYRDGMPHQGRDGCIGAQWFNGSYNCLIC